MAAAVRWRQCMSYRAYEHKEHTVDQVSQASTSSEPPSPAAGIVSFPSRAFGAESARRRSFLQALLDGVLECESRRGGANAPRPLPAA
jgi:hypothetical protein